MNKNYSALTLDELPKRLSSITAITDQIGTDFSKWQVTEVGDGNLNLVFIVIGSNGKIVIKQALPYVRVVGDSWPLTLDRAFFEYNALVRQEQRDPGIAPSVFYFDREQGLIAMECLDSHKILRGKLIAGEKVSNLGEVIGKHCARLAFKGSDFYMQTKDKKNDVSLFQNNLELMSITENLVFTDPYYEAEMNNHTEGLDPIVKTLRDDVVMKSKVQYMLLKFTSNTETMCHGDLHSGSIMCTENDTKVIDPEFAFYGPMGFDLGMNIANYLMAFLSQPAHRKNSNDIKSFQGWILKVIEETVNAFFEEFTNLWHNSRRGILFPKCLYEDQDQTTDYALNLVLKHILNDAMSICGIEMHRRCLSLAHNADFEQIEDVTLRAKLEARNLLLGRELILCSNNIKDISELTSLASKFNERNIL